MGADERFELVTPHPFGLVCFRLRADDDATADDDANKEFLRRINASGEIFLTHTEVQGRYTLRFAVGSPLTAGEHVRTAWELIRDTAETLLGS